MNCACWTGTAIQITVRRIRGTKDWCEVQALQDTGGVEASRTALLSQEGSTIETPVEIVRGVVPEPHSLRMHSEIFRLGNHPSRHRKERDDAALLTQEGSSPPFTVTIILYRESILDNSACPGGAIHRMIQTETLPLLHINCHSVQPFLFQPLDPAPLAYWPKGQ